MTMNSTMDNYVTEFMISGNNALPSSVKATENIIDREFTFCFTFSFHNGLTIEA
jgi:hypothetical protein